MLSSQTLEIGKVYTREELRSKFGITDATINTGVFQPAGHESIWLFITQNKTSDRTQYSDNLDGDDLQWDGQTEGRKDDLIIEHAQKGLELLVFYRRQKYEHDGAAFRYEGPFDYVSHAGSHPAHFHLRRRSLFMIDDLVMQGLKKTLEEMKSQEKLPSQAQIDRDYASFRQRFGPDVLRRLDGEELLNTLHAHGNRESLVYWLEFKDDDEFHGYGFGSIAGGSANKFGIWRRKEDSVWVAADGHDQRELSLEEAIAIARRNRDQFIKGCEALQELPQDGNDQAYMALQQELDRVAPDVSDSAWGHKYFHMMFPNKLDDYHVLQFQRFYLIKLLQNPPEGEGRYLAGGRYVALAKAIGLPITMATGVLIARYGRPYRSWRIGTSDGNEPRNQWGPMRENNCVAVGWPDVGDLTSIEHSRGGREKLKSLMQEHYPKAPQAVGRATQQLFNFRGAIAEDDMVVAMDGGTVLGIGKVTGRYEYEPSSSFPNHLPVDWLSLDEWKPAQPEGLQTTVHELKTVPKLIEIERHLIQPVRPGPVPKGSEKKPARHLALAGIPGRIQAVLERKGQAVLYGPPGTGKTYWARLAARELAAMHNFGKTAGELSAQDLERIESLTEDARPFVRMCCFHPSYSYEDFIEGYRPQLTDGSMAFTLKNGVFKKLCEDAASDGTHRYYLIIDEVNRGDIPRIFGELMTVLERDKRDTPVVLPLTGSSLVVPPNLYIIATMNTADRSIALLDTALRRRFGFVELMPDSKVLAGASANGIPLGPWLDALNSLILQHVGRDARNLQVGHSFLMEGSRPINDFTKFAKAVREEIIPLIQEYCYEDYAACEKILGKSLINAEKQQIRDDIFDPARQEDLEKALMSICPEVSATPQAVTAEAQQAEAESGEEDAPEA